MNMEPISVSALTAQIKAALSGRTFQNIAVQGEISNFIHHTSGHMYFSLKDDQSRIKAVMFRGRNRLLNFTPQNGDTLIARGSLGVYEPNGEYQLYVDQLSLRGVGDLHLAFLKLKERLEKEGLFAPERKIPLPFFPAKIGVVTSPDGAAVRDIIQVLSRRCPAVKVVVFPAAVQGEGAPASLIKALRQAQDTDLDLIIIGRGGGSFEELAAFNDENLARAIALCPLPVISAVGHETDFTISDFVADLRAPTPSAGAELAVPRQDDLQAEVQNTLGRICRAVLRKTASERRYLEQLTAAPALRQPQNSIRILRQRVDELWTSLVKHNEHALALRRAELANCLGKIETLSPLKTLSRGYSICQDQQGQLIRRAEQVEVGAALDLILHRGRLQCRVERRETEHDRAW